LTNTKHAFWVHLVTLSIHLARFPTRGIFDTFSPHTSVTISRTTHVILAVHPTHVRRYAHSRLAQPTVRQRPVTLRVRLARAPTQGRAHAVAPGEETAHALGAVALAVAVGGVVADGVASAADAQVADAFGAAVRVGAAVFVRRTGCGTACGSLARPIGTKCAAIWGIDTVSVILTNRRTCTSAPKIIADRAMVCTLDRRLARSSTV